VSKEVEIRRIRGEDESSAASEMKVSKSGRIPTIEYAHMAVHEDGLCIATYFTSAAPSSAATTILVQTTGTYDLHSYFDIVGTVGLKVELYETGSSNVTAPGSSATVCRLNRNSTIPDSSRQFTYSGPTLSTSARDSLLYIRHNGGSTSAQGNAQVFGGASRNGEEFVLVPGQAYVIDITPEIAGKVSFVHEYYEVSR